MSFRRKLFVVAVVYVVEGFPMGVFTGVWPAFFADVGVPLREIGFAAGLSIAWSLKVLWSPLVDRFGEWRQWITGAQFALGASLFALSGFEGGHFAAWTWLVLASYCAASATQDIAIDAYTIGLIDHGDEGPANAMRMTGYRIGMVGLANALLFLPAWIGWEGALFTAALLHVAMALGATRIPRVEVPPEKRRAMWSALARWLSRPGALPVFAFVLLYRIGDSTMAPMVTPFWKHSGLTNEEIATVSGILGGLATLVGAWLAASIVSRIGIGRSLLWIGALALGSNLAYAAVAAFPETGRYGVYAASLTESFCAGMAGVAFMSFLMRICEKEHAAVQYALLTAIYNLAGSLLRIPSGIFAEALGYAGYFALTGAFALPAFAFLPRARRWLNE
ncbi:MAG: MFS transporter [Myxococcota bacterium]|nr:hypothetical protein [Deltaproteobacteria bacterium]MCP4239223.1 AmpG family muropeptide MFS transporter [bacterium]MDP6075916.1 MFS transporter [Myxococcota bacterium]MDP6242318.1 MFS transporter [Myxococcota bacterium]MDP7076439.1 MFS transporter [Myxococcota bacterium]